MDLASRLLLLLEVYELGSFAKVAEYRNVNRSAISKQITKLEEELEVHLLNRSTRAISFTAAGVEMLNQAKQLRTVLSNSKRLAQNYHTEPRGELKIASPTLFGRQYVQQAVTIYQEKYPDVTIELLLEDRLVDVIGEGFDLGIRMGEPLESNLIARKIARNRLLLLASPAYLAKFGEPESIAELEQLPAVVYCAPGLVIDKIKYIDESGKQAFLHLNTAYKVNEAELLIKTALNGRMLTAATAQMLGDEVKNGELTPIMTGIELSNYGNFFAVYPHRDLALKTQLFLDILTDIVGSPTPVWENRIPGFNKMYGFDEP